jgi:hypothetical protein
VTPRKGVYPIPPPAPAGLLYRNAAVQKNPSIRNAMLPVRTAASSTDTAANTIVFHQGIGCHDRLSRNGGAIGVFAAATRRLTPPGFLSVRNQKSRGAYPGEQAEQEQ